LKNDAAVFVEVGAPDTVCDTNGNGSGGEEASKPTSPGPAHTEEAVGDDGVVEIDEEH
jgi:hypothetical protein